MTTHRPLSLHTEQYLVLASCLSMAVRITYASTHAKRFFGSGMSLSQLTPHPIIVSIAIGGGAVLRALHGPRVLAATAAFGVLTLGAL